MGVFGNTAAMVRLPVVIILVSGHFNLANAIIKISWRLAPTGAVQLPVEGGVCGTCFTFESGITISCVHTMRNLFIPNPGFDACQVFVVGSDGETTKIEQSCICFHPNYDTCIISGYQSRTKYRVSKKPPDQVGKCRLLGYKAHTTPFQCRIDSAGTGIEIVNPDIDSVAQDLRGITPKPTSFTLNSADLNVSDRPGYLMGVAATVGISGGPMLDAENGEVVGMCFFGTPPDQYAKTQIGAIDVRQFPFV